MNLPLDLLELIIECLAQEEDLDSVRACSLTSGQLVQICRKHLFSSIKIFKAPQRADITKKFGRLLEQNPSLSSHVRELEIHLPMGYASEDELGFLHHLNLVDCFTIGFADFNESGVEQTEWSSLSKGFVDSLLSFIERNPVTQLLLFGIHGFPLSTFRLFSDLEKVILLDMTPSTAVGTDALIAPIPLRTLDLRQGFKVPLDQTFTLSSKSFDLTNLKQLLVELRYEAQNMDLLRRLLSMCGCLEVLDIVVQGCTNPPNLKNVARHISPNSLKTLRNLHITLDIPRGENCPPYGCFDDELSLISGSNVLELLEFTIVAVSGRIDPTHAAWDRLDEVLSVDGGFPFLKTVKVDVLICHHGVAGELRWIKRGIDNILEQNFQRLKKKLTFIHVTEVRRI